MINSLDTKISAILAMLKENFPDTWACCYADITEIHCQLGPSLIDGAINFPLYNEDIEQYSPRQIVGAIWEYIIRYML
jgi:hypothetical protein